MKKEFLAVALAAVSVCALSVGLTACGGEEAKTYEGEYHYANAWDATAPDYGVKVKVTVTGDKIDKVEIVKSDYTQLSAANDKAGWTEENRKNYTDNEQKLLDSFEGKTIDEVKAYTASIQGVSGATENKVTAEGLSVITGATQSTARIILAVQDALADAE